MPPTPPLTVVAVPELEPAADVFRALLADGLDAGSSLAVMRGGQTLLSAAGGWADTERTRPFTDRTLTRVFSAGKPVAALAALTAVADGHLTLDDPLGRWWPAYATRGKAATTLRHLLSHRAGLPSFSPAAEQIDALDAEALLDDLVASTPIAPPGEVIAEHALTYGTLIDGLLAQAGAPDARTAAARLEALWATGAAPGDGPVELRFGVGRDEHPLVADLEAIDPDWAAPYLAREGGQRMLDRPRGHLDPARLNSAPWRAASMPATGLFTTASSLARFYDDVHRANGRVAARLGSALHAEYLAPQAVGHDLFVDGPVEWSLGLRIDGGEIGMGGIGGSSAWYSPGRDYSFAFVTRSLGTFARVDALADAVEAALPAPAA
ncbi:beta-lactamase family protein [Herbiconiux sp. VKM Ac-1786]|uniref:serine hydrolase domain-containing protein n=1 Tax=Herbiconiux sp. VKM Ac-1786 TaxID=2783824 RepID=UPI00188CD58A|nr:beta-lactamase family protein [Herbiconiux sp. VKM Ac-1786]